MLYLNRLRLRFRSLFHKKQLDHQLDAELDFHLAEQKAELITSGLSNLEAEREARRLFGPLTHLAEQCRDTRRTQWLEDFANDTVYAVRSLRLSPSFAVVSILTLALGIGANTAFFSTAYGILFRPLPYPAPEKLINLEDGIGGVGPVTSLRDLAKAADYAGYLPNNQFNLFQNGEASRIDASTATSNLLAVLAVAPALGRWFTRAEEQAGRHRVAVLSDRTWRERFNADPAILGRKMLLNEESFAITGVMPPGFAFPTPATDIWIPIVIDPRDVGNLWGSGNLLAIGRLHRTATLAAAQAELKSVVNRVRAMFPWRMPDLYGASSRLVLHDEALARQVRPKLIVLASSTLLLLLIACGNVANLLLARAIQRQREFAMREALGANPGRLLRQLLTENLVLVLAGGLGGLLAALLIFESLPLLLPNDTPRLHEIMADPALLLGALLSLLLCIALFSAAPIFQLLRPRRVALIGRAVTATKNSSRLSLALIGVELALATTLLIGAGLMGRTLWQLSQIDSGLQSSGVVTAHVSAGPSRCKNRDDCAAFIDSLNRNLLAVPGVQSVAWASLAPLEKEFSAVASELQDHPRPARDPAIMLWQTIVTPSYFQTLGVPLREGRWFNDADRAGSPRVLILAQSTAKRFWPNESAIGKHIRPLSDREWLTVVGVVGDVLQYSLEGFPDWVDGAQYRPLAQSLSPVTQSLRLTALLRTSQPATTQAALVQSLRPAFPDVVISRVATLDQVRASSTTSQRSTAWLLALFAALGLSLAIAGVHGVIAHRAAQRTRELGIRMALGANSSSLLALVLRETVLVSLAGTLTGVLAAYAISRFLNSLLFGVTNHDPLAFTLSPLVLLVAATLAAALPAARVLRTDPALSLSRD